MNTTDTAWDATHEEVEEASFVEGSWQFWDRVAASLYEISCKRYVVEESEARLLISVMVQAGKDMYNSKTTEENRQSAIDYIYGDVFEYDCKLVALCPDSVRKILTHPNNKFLQS